MAQASEPKTKRCALPGGCGRRRRLSKFSKDKSKKDGRCSYCSDCTRKKREAYRNTAAGRQKIQEWREKQRKEDEEILRRAIERQHRLDEQRAQYAQTYRQAMNATAH